MNAIVVELREVLVRSLGMKQMNDSSTAAGRDATKIEPAYPSVDSVLTYWLGCI